MTKSLGQRTAIVEPPLGHSPVQVEIAEPPNCHRCGHPALLSARLPHGWQNNNGQHVQGTIRVVLCPDCDASTPHADPLITYLTEHHDLTADTASGLATLLLDWTTHLRSLHGDQTQLDSETDGSR